MSQYKIAIVSEQCWSELTTTSARGLIEEVERLVADRTLAPGDRLPPVRRLADLLDLAPNTVAAAYRELAGRGFVVGRGRRGTFVTERASFPQFTEPAVPEGLVDLASGNPDRSLLPSLDPHLPTLGQSSPVLYGGPALDPGFERIARDLLESCGVPPRRVAAVSGALDGVERALETHLRLGDMVAVEAPGWPAVADLVSTMGLRPVAVPVDEKGMIPERLAAVCGRASAVILTPRGQNPTGAAHDVERAVSLSAVLAPHPELLVIEDDHAGLITGAPLCAVGPDRRLWVYIQSMSKSLGPDLRVAIVTGDDLTMGRLQARQAAGPGWVSHLLQRLVAELLSDAAVIGHLDAAAATYTARRTALIDSLAVRGVTATGPTGLNVWVPVDDEAAVVAAMAGRGYAVASGERWRMGTPPAVRVSIGAVALPEMPDVADALAAAVTADNITTPTKRTV